LILHISQNTARINNKKSQYFRPPAAIAGQAGLYYAKVFSLFFFPFRRLISEVAWSILTKFCNVFGSDC